MATSFHLSVCGELQWVEHRDAVSLYARWALLAGPLWRNCDASDDTTLLRSGVTQTAERAAGPRPIFGFNLPFAATWAADSPTGWPRFAVALFEADGSGGDVPKGYGWCHIPATAAASVVTIPLFVPLAPADPPSLLSMLSPAPKRAGEFVSADWVAQPHASRDGVSVRAARGVAVVRFLVTLPDLFPPSAA